MKKFPKGLVWIVVAAVVIGGFYWLSSRREVEVEVGEVTRGPVEQYVTEEAETRLHTSRIVSALTSGVAARIELEEGEEVAAGRLITTIEDTQLKAMLQGATAKTAEVKALLEGVDVPLPKAAEIKAAEARAKHAGEQLEVARREEGVAKANFVLADKSLKRAKNLVEKKTIPQEDCDKAQRDFDVARLQVEAGGLHVRAAAAAAEVAALEHNVLLASLDDTKHMHKVYAAQITQAEAELARVATDLERTRVTSPIDGVLLEKYVDAEGYVNAGAQLVLVGDPASIEIESDILSDEVGDVAVGQTVRLVGPAMKGKDAVGKVKQIYPSGFTKVSSLGVRQQRVKVLVEFDNAELALGAGYELDVRIVIDARKDAVLIPAAAVFATHEGMGAFRIREGKAELVAVSTGIQGDDYYEVLSGVEAGDEVIVRPPRDIEPGTRVVRE